LSRRGELFYPTASGTVILEAQARKAAAPTVPGEMSRISWPIRRPKSAPASRAGMMIPNGTLQPNVMVVRISLTEVP